MARNTERLSATEKKELIRQVDSVEIALSSGEIPEPVLAARIRREAREYLKKELAHISSRSEANELVESTFALMRSFDAGNADIASQFSRGRLRTEHDSQVAREGLSQEVQGGLGGVIASDAAFEALSKSPVAVVRKARTADGREVYVSTGGSTSTEKKEAAIAFSQANGNVYVYVDASMGGYYINGTDPSWTPRRDAARIDQPTSISFASAPAVPAQSRQSSASATASGTAARSTPSAASSRGASPEVGPDGLPSIGRVDLGGDYSKDSYERIVPAFTNQKSVSVAALKGVKTSILGQGVLVRSLDGTRSKSLARGAAVTLSGEVVYMRASNSSTPLPYVVLEGSNTAVAAKFVKAVSAPAAAPAPAPAASASTTPPTGQLSGVNTPAPAPAPAAAPAPAPAASASTTPPTGQLSGVNTPAPAPAPAPAAAAPATPALGTVPNPSRPTEHGTIRASAEALANRWAVSNETAHRSVLASLTDTDIHEAWRTDEVRVVMTPEGARIWRDEKNYKIVTFADLKKTEFERAATPALQAKAEDMELMLKAAVASDGNKKEFSNAYEAFATAMARYTAGNDTEINKAMDDAAAMFDAEFGGWGTWIGGGVSSMAGRGTVHKVKDIMAKTDATERRKMAYEWSRYVSHDTLKETILNDRFESLTKVAGSEITANDLATLETMLGDFGNTLVISNLERGILDPATVSDPAQQAVCQKLNAVFSAGRKPEERKAAIEKFMNNLRRKVVDGGHDGGSEASKYLKANEQANYEAIRTQVRARLNIDINEIPAGSLGRNDLEKQAIQMRVNAEKAIRAHVTSIFALTAIKAGIFDAAAEAAVKADTLKNDPSTALYGDIMGMTSWYNVSDSTYQISANALGFVIPEIIGMAVGMGIGYVAMRGLSLAYTGLRGVSAARTAMGVGRLASATRIAGLGVEGAVYGGTMYGGGLIAPNLLHGRDWNEGFDRKELFFSVGLGAFYPLIHTLSPFNKIISGQGLMGKSLRFSANTVFDSGLVLALGNGADALLDITLGEGEYFEKDFWQILTMMPLMRLGMNLSAGTRHKFMFEKNSRGEIVATVLNRKSAVFADEVSSSMAALRNAPEGTAVIFPGSTVKRLPDGSYIVKNTATSAETSIASSLIPGKTGRDLLAAVRANAPEELTTDMMAAMSRSRVEAELASQIPDSVALAGGYRAKIDNPSAAVADRRYSLMDSSGAVIASGVEKSKLKSFIDLAVDPRNDIITQLRAGVPEVGGAAGIRVTVRNPEAAENLRVCDVYHKGVKIGDGLLLDQVDARLGSIFASVDDANITRMVNELQGTPAKLANADGALGVKLSGARGAERYEINHGGAKLDRLSRAEAETLLERGITPKNGTEIKNALDPAAPPATVSTHGLPIEGELHVRYDATLPLTATPPALPRKYELFRRDPVTGAETVIASNIEYPQMEGIMQHGIAKPTGPVPAFLDAMHFDTAGVASSAHANLILKPSATAGKFDIEIVPPAGSPAGTPNQVYANGLTIDQAKNILSGGSLPGHAAPAFLTPLRGPLAPNSVSYGNLKVTVEDATKAVADRTYKVECDGALFGRGMKLDEVDAYLTQARAVADIDVALGRLAPVDAAGAPLPRVANIAGTEIRQNADGTFSYGTRTNVSRADTIAEFAARERAGNTLFGKDSPLVSGYIDRITQRLDKNTEVELKFGTNVVKIKRTGGNSYEISGGSGSAAPDKVEWFLNNTQAKIREYVAKRAGIEANGVRYLEENAPAVLEKAFQSLKGKTLRQAAGDTYETSINRIKNTKAKDLLAGLFSRENVPFYEGLVKNLPEAIHKGPFGILGWVLTGGAKTHGFWGTLWQILKTQAGAYALTVGVNMGDSWYRGEGFLAGLNNTNQDNWGERIVSSFAFGSSGAFAAGLAAIILNLDYSHFTGGTESDLLTYIGQQLKKAA